MIGVAGIRSKICTLQRSTQCCTGFERKAVFSEILEYPGDNFVTPICKSAMTQNRHYLRMPSLPMTVL